MVSESHDGTCRPTTQPVAIVGAGWLGASLARALPPPVVVTTRCGRWTQSDAAPPGVEVAALDVSVPDIDITPLRNVRALVLCYAPGRTQDRRALYVEGTRRLLSACMRGGMRLRRVVYVGSTSALPDVDGWVDETCEPWPEHERGRVQREAEAEIASICTGAGVPFLVLRMGGLYGPGRELTRIYTARQRRRQSTADGRVTLSGHGMEPTNLIHREDAVAALIAALRAAPEVQGCIHVVDDDHAPRREMYARIAQALDIEPVAWSEPPPAGSRAVGKRVRNDRLRTVLGVSLRHPMHEFDAA